MMSGKRNVRYRDTKQLDLFKKSKIRTLSDEVKELRGLINILTMDINSLRKDMRILKNSIDKT